MRNNNKQIEAQRKPISEYFEQQYALKAQLTQYTRQNQMLEMEIAQLQKSNEMKKNHNRIIKENIRSVHKQMQTITNNHLKMFQETMQKDNSSVVHNQFGLTPFQLMKLPTMKYQKRYNDTSMQMCDYRSCLLCYEELKNQARVKSLPQCKHLFHSHCIKQHLIVSRHCPACDQEVKFN